MVVLGVSSRVIDRLEALGLRVGMILAGARADDAAEVQLASVQTITARQAVPPADLLVWDEAHHCAAETYRAIAARYPDAWHLGLTATPMRADGAGLGDAFDALVVGATVAELTRDGYLAPCDALAPVAEVKGIAQDPVEAVRAHAPDRRVVVFQRSVEYSRDCCARGGPRWAHVDGKTPAGERAATLERFARGELDVLSNVFVLTEGWDCPAADVVVLAGVDTGGVRPVGGGRGDRGTRVDHADRGRRAGRDLHHLVDQPCQPRGAAPPDDAVLQHALHQMLAVTTNNALAFCQRHIRKTACQINQPHLAPFCCQEIGHKAQPTGKPTNNRNRQPVNQPQEDERDTH